MAEQDGEFARCLRSDASDPVSRQVERLKALMERFGGTPSRPATRVVLKGFSRRRCNGRDAGG